MALVYTVSSTAAQDSTIQTNASLTSLSQTDDFSPNDSASISSTVNTQADLRVTITDAPDPVIAGNNITYTVTMFNDGPSNAQSVTSNSNLQSSLSLVTTSGCTVDVPASINCGLGSIAVGESAQYTMVAAVAPSFIGSRNNQVSVNATTTRINTSNDNATASTTVTGQADLSIAKTDSPDPVLAGNNLVYTITVNNAGPSHAFDVVVADTLPSGVSVVSTSGCDTNPGVPNCTLGTIAAGGSGQYTLTVRVDSNLLSGTLTNSATVSSSTADPTSGNNSTSTGTTVSTQADLSVSVIDNPDPVVAGNNITYTVTVNNNGPSDAQNVLVTNTLPTDTTFVSSSGCTEDPAGVPSCSLGTITSGNSKQFTITATLDADIPSGTTLSNQAVATSSTNLANTSDDSVTTNTTVSAEADLGVGVVDSPDPVVAGNELTYTISVNNSGPSDAQNVAVTDTLPDGVTLVSTSGCTEDPSGVADCTLGTIAAGGSAQYTITAAVDADVLVGATLSNTAIVSADTTLIDTDDDEVSTDTTVSAQADLSITINDNFDPIISGIDLSYTTTVANAGPSDAQAVVVASTLPDGVTFVSTSGCVEDPNGNPNCTLGAVEAGGSEQYTLVVNVDDATRGSINTGVSVSSSTTLTGTENDTASEDTEVVAPPTVEFSQAAYQVGEDGSVISAAITLTRTGNTDFATTVQITTVEGAVQPATGVPGGGIGSDYNNDPIVVNFPAASDDNQTVIVPITQDTITEANETVDLSISNLLSAIIGTQNTATLTIVNDDTSNVRINTAIMAEGNGSGTTAIEFEVALDSDVQGGFSINFATNDDSATLADNDYQITTGTLLFAGTTGETNNISVLVNTDDVIEPNETFLVVLGPVSISNPEIDIGGVIIEDSGGIGTIMNDDFDEDSDTIVDQLDNCPAIANTDQANLDLDLLGDVCDSDADGDGMPNDWEIENGLNPLSSFDQLGDRDRDGFSNLEEFRFGTDPNVFDGDEDNNGRPDIFDQRIKSVLPVINLYLLDNEEEVSP